MKLVYVTILAGVAGCSLPVIGGRSAAPMPTEDVVATRPDGSEATVVQVRGFRRSSTVSVVAWDADEAAFGLRVAVSRSGELVGGSEFGEHRLYMTPLLAQTMGGFKYASLAPWDLLLLGAGAQRDPYSCFYGRKCSPMVTVGVGVPDSLLRANRDSLTVTFFPGVREPWTLTLRRELITAYLNKVDSVRTDMWMASR